jgi:hypothetical protein
VSSVCIDADMRVDVSTGDSIERAANRIDGLGLAAAWVLSESVLGDSRSVQAETEAGDARLCVIPVLGPPAAHPGIVARARLQATSGSVRVVGLRPARDRYPLADWVLSPLPEICEREQLALILDYVGTPMPWLEIVPFARRYPGLPMLLLGTAVGGDQAAPAALDAAANLVLGVGRLRAARDLARLVDVFGSQRFAYASGTGTIEQGITRLHEIRATELDDEAERGILGGTATALAEGRYAEAFL